ncbi:phospholipase D family protein [Enterococcus sp. N342-3-1-2]
MKFFDTNLYENVIIKNAKLSNKLRIISGYGSAKFAKKVMNDFPHLSIDLFLGMSLQGISKENHSEFIALMTLNDKFQVFYQIENPVTHIKLYQFLNDDKVIATFCGSANFTSHGFIEWHEMLTITEENVSGLIENQQNISLLANNSFIEDYILFYDENILNIDANTVNSFETDNSIIKNIETRTQTKKITNNKLFWSRLNRSSLEEIKIPILYENSKLYAPVNAKFFNSIGYLMQPNGVSFEKFFPIGESLQFLTDDGIVLQGEVPIGKSRRLYFHREIYDYIFSRLNISENKPLVWEQLLNYGRTDIVVYKEDNKHYLLDFHQPK